MRRSCRKEENASGSSLLTTSDIIATEYTIRFIAIHRGSVELLSAWLLLLLLLARVYES